MSDVDGNYEVGDIVKLLSGGPLMTVATLVNSHGQHHCIWFSEEGKVQSSGFPASTLEYVE